MFVNLCVYKHTQLEKLTLFLWLHTGDSRDLSRHVFVLSRPVFVNMMSLQTFTQR